MGTDERSAYLPQFKWLETEPSQPLRQRKHLHSCVFDVVYSIMLCGFHSSLSQLMVLPTLYFHPFYCTDLSISSALHWAQSVLRKQLSFFHIHFLLDLHAEMTQHREGQTNSARERSGFWKRVGLWHPVINSGYVCASGCCISQGNRQGLPGLCCKFAFSNFHLSCRKFRKLKTKCRAWDHHVAFPTHLLPSTAYCLFEIDSVKNRLTCFSKAYL